jgi:hypothetical protein
MAESAKGTAPTTVVSVFVGASCTTCTASHGAISNRDVEFRGLTPGTKVDVAWTWWREGDAKFVEPRFRAWKQEVVASSGGVTVAVPAEPNALGYGELRL